MVADLAQKAGLPMPKIGISEIAMPNAFAFGRSQKDSRVCVTRGILSILSPEELKNVPSAPGSLEDALKALERDHDFLLKGDVFTEDVVGAWIDYKMTKEVKPMALRPHPFEFQLYYDI